MLAGMVESRMRAVTWPFGKAPVSHPPHRTGEADLRINTSRPFPEARACRPGRPVQRGPAKASARTHIRAAARADLKKNRWQVSPTRGTSRTPRRSPTNGWRITRGDLRTHSQLCPRLIDEFEAKTHDAQGRAQPLSKHEILTNTALPTSEHIFSISFRLTHNPTVVELRYNLWITNQAANKRKLTALISMCQPWLLR